MDLNRALAIQPVLSVSNPLARDSGRSRGYVT